MYRALFHLHIDVSRLEVEISKTIKKHFSTENVWIVLINV